MPLKLLMEAKDVQSHDGDRISRLPDDIILAILEKVSICTVIRTSILSTRWRRLPLLLSHIYLEAEDFMPQNTEVADFRLIDEAMAALVGLLCSFLAAPTTESTIRTLSLRVGLIADRLCDIGKLVCSAIDCGKLKNLELEIPTVKDPLQSDDKDRQEHAQSLICLFESYPRMFCYLTKLDLYNASFRETDMLHLLNSCEQLQNLILNECDTGYLSILKMDLPNSKLRVLELYSCRFQRVQLFCLPKLVQLHCENWAFVPHAVPVSFDFVPCLEELKLIRPATREHSRFKITELLGDKTLAGRVTWVRFVLSAIPIYVLIAINVPKWFIRAIDKLRRAFLWKGREQVNGGSCLVSWTKVCMPLELGGLGILNLEIMGWALQIRWLWYKKTDLNRPWRGLDIPVHSNAMALFAIALETHVGRGNNTLFWTDKWLFGCALSELAPAVVNLVPPRIRKQRTVADALLNHGWPSDIQGGLSLIGMFEYFQLWDIIHEVVLIEEEDNHVWRLDSSGHFSSRSAYRAFFNGRMGFEPWKRLWKSWAPAKCKVFLWLAIRNRCWTADRLARRGLPHPDQCPLCDQADEDVQHILTSCVFARDFWFKILQKYGLQRCAPNQRESSFANWWRKAIKKVPKQQRKGLNSLIILGAWLLWKHRNSCVFNGATPNISDLMRAFDDELHLWCLAGARRLRSLDIWIEPEGKELRNSFRALRKLFLRGIYVEFDLLWTLLLLEAAPSIQIFGIQIWDHTCGEDNRALYSERTIGAWDAKKLGGSTACLQLKALEIRGFKQVKEHLDFIRAVMERAPNLETLLLEGKEYCKGCEATDYSVCSSLMSMFPMNKDEEDIVVKQIRADGLNHPVRIIFRRPL
ncbi:hypothetical protein ACP70R_016669 [Stipagrostis hirtigluma subsp. patula]